MATTGHENESINVGGLKSSLQALKTKYVDDLDSRVDTLETAVGSGGSVDTRISNAIKGLDSTKSQTAGTDGLALSVTETDGKITSISGSIASNTYDSYGAATSAANIAKTDVIGGASSSGNTLKKLEDRLTPVEVAVGSGGSIDTRISGAVGAETARAQAVESSLSSGKADKATTLAGYGITDAYTKSETYTKTEVNGLVDTPHQEYVTVNAYSALPASGSKDTIYRVSNYNGSTSQVDASVYSEYAWNGTQYIFLCVKSQIGEVFDISVYNNNAKYADLAAALNGGANIPQSLQKGGMSVKFVQSSNNIDNVYVQYRLMTNTFTYAEGAWNKEPKESWYLTVPDPDYSNDVSEVYIEDAPSGNFILKNYRGSAYGYVPSSGVIARSSAINENDKVYALRIYITNDPIKYPIGKVYAYVVFKNYQDFISKSNSGESLSFTIDRERASLLHNCPLISDYINTNTLQSDIYGDKQYLDEAHSVFPTSGITSAKLLKSFMIDFKILVPHEDGYEYGVLKINNGLPASAFYAYCVCVYKWPSGEEPSVNNYSVVGVYFGGSTKPANGLVKTSNGAASFVLNWDALTEQFGSTSWTEGTGTGVRYNQNYIFDADAGKGILDDINDINNDIDELRSEIEDITVDKVEVCIPDTIFAVVGDTLQLYYRSIYRCVDYSKYAIHVSCDVGAQYPRYFELTPLQDQVGNYQITFAIKDNNNTLLGTKTANLVITDVIRSPQNNINVLCLGASATSGGQWASEFKRRLVGTGGFPAGKNLTNINFVGRMNVTYDDKQVNLEATGGYSFPSYTSTTGRTHIFYFTEEHLAGELNVNDVYSYNGHNYTVKEINLTEGVGNVSCSGDADVYGSLGTLTKVSGTGSQSMVFQSCRSLGNPFVYNGSINMQQYADDYCNPQSAVHGKIDVIYTELFGNGTPAYADNLLYRMDQMMAFINQVTSIFPNCKFCIGLFWNPDIKGGMGRNYGATGTWSDPYAIKYSNMNMCNVLQKYINDNNLADYVFILNWLNEFDEENDMQQTTKTVNPRSSVTEIFGVNGVHPSTVGYYQMADTACRLFISKFCQ